jgi:hypothetical protein
MSFQIERGNEILQTSLWRAGRGLREVGRPSFEVDRATRCRIGSTAGTRANA